MASPAATPAEPDHDAVAAEAAPPATWQLLPLARGLGTQAADWEALRLRWSGTRASLAAACIDAQLRHLGRGDEQLAVLRSEAEVLAMVVLQPQGGGSWASWAPEGAPVGAALVPEPQALLALWPLLPAGTRSIRLLRLDPAFAHQGPPPDPAEVVHRHTARSATLIAPLGLPPPDGADGLRHEVLATPEALAALLPRHASGAGPGFVPAAWQELAGQGLAELHALWSGDRLLATQPLLRGGQTLQLLPAVEQGPGGSAPRLLAHVLHELLARCPGQRLDLPEAAPAEAGTEAASVADIVLFRPPALAAWWRLWRPAPGRARAAGTVSVHEDLVTLPPAVTALFDRAERRHGIQAGLPWLQRLARTVYAERSQVRLFVLHQGGEAVTALPLVLTADAPTVVQALRNYYSSLFVPPMDEGLGPEDLLPLVRAVGAHWPGAVEWRLDPMDPHGQAYRLLRPALARCGLVSFCFFRFGNWYLRTQGLGWTDFMRTRKGGLRSTISRMTKKLAASDGRLELVTQGDRLEAGMQAYEQVYAASWKQAEPHPEFVRELMRECAALGTLRLGLAWVGGQAIAAQIWLVRAGRAEIFKVAYDEAHKALSPGTLVTALVMEHVLEVDRVREVDYLTGDDAYKRIWMSDRRERWGLVAYRLARPRGLVRALREGLARAGRPLIARLRAGGGPR